jgi:hypothetical protein
MKDLTISDSNRNYFLKNRRLIILLAGTLLMTVVMTIHGASLKTPGTPKGILNLEFAYNTAQASSVLNAWAATSATNNIIQAKMNTWLDFIYLFFYSLFFFHACQLLASSFSGSIQITGSLLAKGALIAGMLDILENTGMLLTLNGQLSQYTTLLTFIFSISKWALLIAAIMYVGLMGSLLVKRKIGKVSPN